MADDSSTYPERALDLDGRDITIRLQIETGLGPVVAPFGQFPVSRVAIGLDDGGLFINIACVGAKPDGPLSALLKRLPS